MHTYEMKLQTLGDGTGRESIYPGAVMTREQSVDCFDINLCKIEKL